MLLGEHSVVHGKPALLAALWPKITIEWCAITEQKIQIQSELAEFETDLNNIEVLPALNFVLLAIKNFPAKLPSGFALKISSEFPADWGLGSSAAVLAATLVGLNQICQTKLSTWELFEIGQQVILAIQQRGSGADLAASLNGGLTYFSPQEKLITSLPAPKELQTFSLIYAGYKTPTAEVLAKVAKDWATRSGCLAEIYQQMGEITKQAINSLQNNQLSNFYQAVADYQIQMEKLGVSDPTIETILAEIAEQKIPAKISGSGLGDCVLALQAFESKQFASLNTKLNLQGASCEQIK